MREQKRLNLQFIGDTSHECEGNDERGLLQRTNLTQMLLAPNEFTLIGQTFLNDLLLREHLIEDSRLSSHRFELVEAVIHIEILADMDVTGATDATIVACGCLVVDVEAAVGQ